MIQLRSELEAVARIKSVPGVTLPTWQRDPGLREQLDGSIRERLLVDGPHPEEKVLVVGASWPELVVALAQLGAFVTVVDTDPDRLAAVSAAAGPTGLLKRITIHADDYKTRSFAASAFHEVVAWDVLNRYTEYEPLIKKFTRELKAGGQLVMRSVVTSAPLRPDMAEAAPELRRLVRSLLTLTGRVAPEVAAQDSFLMPSEFAIDRAGLMDAVEQHLIVKDRIPHHRLAADVADLAAHVAPALRPLVAAAQRLDERLLARRPEVSRFIAVRAVKEKHLGKVFRPGG